MQKVRGCVIMAAMAAERALAGAKIYCDPEREAIEDGVVLIRDGKIAAVGPKGVVELPPGVETLECSGAVITAAFWNSHVHFFERKWADAGAIPAGELTRQLEELTRYGFTNVFDLSSQLENTKRLRARIESGEVCGPRIKTTGEGLVPQGALPSDDVSAVMGIFKTPLPEITDAAQAAAASTKILEQGADGIKLFASSARNAALAQDVMAAAVEVAHRAGKPVFVHPNTAADMLSAALTGIDVVAHTTPRSGDWDENIISAMNERRCALIPTLSLWQYYLRHDRISTQERIVETAVGQLRAWSRAGGAVLFGTDLGAVDCDPTPEYSLMAKAGMPFRETLASLTVSPATRFGESHRFGRVAEGMEADLVVLEADPASRIEHLSSVRYTLRSGKIVYRNPSAIKAK